MTPDSREKNPKVQGVLMMLSNHIGCPEDLPNRSLKALIEADLLIFEDDRHARLALKAAGVHRKYLKFSEHQQKETIETAKEFLLSGKTVAYMSDQGSPTLEDPGPEILAVAYQTAAKIQVVPGPSSITAAISAFPRPLKEFLFLGFLPQKTEERIKAIERIKERRVPIILMDTPYRRHALIETCHKILGHNFSGLLAYDITGPCETYIYGSLATLEKQSKSLDKGNFVLIISP